MIPAELTIWTTTVTGKIVIIFFLFLLAWIIYRLSRLLAGSIFGVNRFISRKPDMRPERAETLIGLVAGAISFTAILLAILFSLSLFIDSTTLIWMVGLFSAALGFAVRPIISDILSGISFIFEDSFDVHEKVDLPGLVGGNVMGIVESVNLRTTVIRSMTGEPFVVPNGEIRIIRNFSRGDYSMANIKIHFATADLGKAIPLLETLGQEAVGLLPNLLEPWQVISESGELGQQTELTLIAKARFGKAGKMRPSLLNLVQERMTEVGVDFSG